MPTPLYLSTEAGDHLITEGGSPLVQERTYALYGGYNIFDIPVNWADEPTEILRRSMTILDNRTGRPVARSHTVSPVGRMEVLITLPTRQEIAEFLSWLAVLRGRHIPVWVPTWSEDLKATADLSGTSITVESVGYEDGLFPQNARKHLAIIDHEKTIYPRGVTAANDNGTTETLTIDTTLGTTLDKDHAMICFLLFCRLRDDRVSVRWIKHNLAEVRVGFVEAPREVSAP